MERKLIAAAVSSALALPMAAQAVEFSVSGQVNRAIISVDGGANDGALQHVDANSSNSRFRFTGSEELESGMTVGVQLELAALNGADTGPTIRHGNAYLSTVGGKLTLGQGSTAADGMAHADLGGPSWLGGVSNWCSYHGFAASPACHSNDGGRSPVLRYDTPAVGPASIAVSTGDNDYWDAKISMAGSMGDAGYDLRLGHIGEHDAVTEASHATMSRADLTGDETGVIHEIGGGLVDVYTPAATTAAGDITTASAAVAFGQGTSVQGAWSRDRTKDIEYQYVKVDHSYGDGSVGVYYKRGEQAGTDGSLWGVGIGHDLGSGATAYAGYRQISADGKEDIDLGIAGMLVTFN